MARRQSGGLSRPAQVGLFAIASVLLLLAALYFFTNFGGHRAGYRMGLHLANAAGLSPGGQVVFSGVPVGTVSKVSLLPDGSIEVILALTKDIDIPRSSKFGVQSSFTGSPYVVISPPHHYARSDIFPKRVLPVAQQPVGTPPLAIDQLMAQGKALGARAQAVLRMAHGYSGRLMAPVTASRANAARAQAGLKALAPSLMGGLQGTLATARAQMQGAAGALQRRDQGKLDALAASFESSSRAMKQSVQGLRSIAGDPAERRAFRQAMEQVRVTSANMAALSRSMEAVTKNPQTRAELADAGARLRAVVQKVRSLLP